MIITGLSGGEQWEISEWFRSSYQCPTEGNYDRGRFPLREFRKISEISLRQVAPYDVSATPGQLTMDLFLPLRVREKTPNDRSCEAETMAGPYCRSDGRRLCRLLPLPVEPLGDVTFDCGRTDFAWIDIERSRRERAIGMGSDTGDVRVCDRQVRRGEPGRLARRAAKLLDWHGRRGRLYDALCDGGVDPGSSRWSGSRTD